jgi:hypothetical protein
MSKLLDYINSKEFNITYNILWAITIPLWIFLIIYGHDIKQWRIKSIREQKQKELNRSYNEKFEKYKIICRQCKGSGEYPTDVNKLMMDAKLALFINKHLNVDKCSKCVKMPYGDVYDYCDVVNDKYRILVQEYANAGPKIEMASCDKCMGMGQFTSQKPDGSYMTQEEYNENLY